MTRTPIFIGTALMLFFTTSCGTGQPPASQPQLSATDLIPRATALSELPPTWTIEPSLTPSPTSIPSPTPSPTQDPANFQISLVMDPIEVHYPDQFPVRSGWKLVSGKTAKILIPANFEELDLGGVLVEMMFGLMQAFAEGFSEFAENLGEELGATPSAGDTSIDLGDAPDFDFVIAMDETSQSALILASVEVQPGNTTEDLLNQALSGTDNEFQVSTREIYLDAPYDMERVILDVYDNELGWGKQLIYAILSDQKGWNLVFTCPTDLLDDFLPLFEGVVDSFSPLPEN